MIYHYNISPILHIHIHIQNKTIFKCSSCFKLLTTVNLFALTCDSISNNIESYLLLTLTQIRLHCCIVNCVLRSVLVVQFNKSSPDQAGCVPQNSMYYVFIKTKNFILNRFKIILNMINCFNSIKRSKFAVLHVSYFALIYNI